MSGIFRFLFQIAIVGAALLATAQPASAESGLVVKLYACPQGQAAITADTLRNEYGVIPGVRVAADERTSQVIVQAPAEVQARISLRLAAAFPDQQPAAEKATGGPVEVRQVPLQKIQADQLEAALWNTLGNRLTALPKQRHGIARLSPGIVGRRGGHDLDRCGGQAGQTGRFRRGTSMPPRA